MDGNSHWNLVIQPGETVTIETSSESNLYITNICIPEVPEKAKEIPNRLFANIITIDPYQDVETVDVSSLEHTHVLLASLIPNVNEHQVTNFCFSPLNIVKLQNQGECAMHLAGYQNYIDNSSDEEEEEEEEEDLEENDKNDDSPDEGTDDDDDEIDQIDVQQKLLALSKQKPKPATKPQPQQHITKKPQPQQTPKKPQSQNHSQPKHNHQQQQQKHVKFGHPKGKPFPKKH